MAKVGAPTKYNTKAAAKLCAEIMQGKSLRSVCEMDGMPGRQTVFVWLGKYPEFRDQYVLAKEASADAMAEDILDIADDGRNDWMERNYRDQTAWVVNGEAVQRSKLRVDSRRWLMAKMQPKRYGELGGLPQGSVLAIPMIYVPKELPYSAVKQEGAIDVDPETAPTNQISSPAAENVVPGTTHSTESYRQTASATTQHSSSGPRGGVDGARGHPAAA